MKKHKIVSFNDDNVAYVQITNDINGLSEDGIKLFIDPDLSACGKLSPELWKVDDGKIIPISDKEELKARLEYLHKPLTRVLEKSEPTLDIYQNQLDNLAGLIQQLETAIPKKSDPQIIENLSLKIEANKIDNKNVLELLEAHIDCADNQYTEFKKYVNHNTITFIGLVDRIKCIEETNKQEMQTLNKKYMIVCILLALLGILDIVY